MNRFPIRLNVLIAVAVAFGLATMILQAWTISTSSRVSMWLGLGSTVVSVASCAYVWLRIREEISNLGTLIRSLRAGGDCSSRENRASLEELHPIHEGLDSIGHLLDALAKDARSASQAMGERCRQFKDSSSDLVDASARNRQASLGMAAALEELVTSLDGIAQNADRIRIVAEETAHDANRLNETSFSNSLLAARLYLSLQGASERMGESVQATKGLDGVGKEISGMAREILDIARSTRLLALNAAIEAQRAGEAGKGFEVVAGEVKVLADQASKLAGRIQTQVEAITEGTADVTTKMEHLRKELDASSEEVFHSVVSSEHLSALSFEANRNIESTREQFGEIARTLEESHTALGAIGASSQDLVTDLKAIDAAITDLDRNTNEMAGIVAEMESSSSFRKEGLRP